MVKRAGFQMMAQAGNGKGGSERNYSFLALTLQWIKSHPFAVPLAAILTVVRLALAYHLPLYTDLQYAYDDGLFWSYAKSITETGWVAPSYSMVATVKTPGYALFLAGCHALSLRPQLAVVLLQMTGSLMAAAAIRPLVGSRRVRLAVYLFLLYAPVLLTREFGQRLYRNCLSAPLILILFSAYIALYLRLGRGVRFLLPWAIMGAFSLGSFSVVNESASWVLPFVMACPAVMLALVFARDQRGLRSAYAIRLATVLILPPLCMLGMRVFVCSQNYSRFGISLTSDKYEGEFGRVSADLVHIQGDVEDQRVWISRKAITSALSASPTLTSIKMQVLQEWDEWTQASPLDVGGTTEMCGDLSFWALMESYQDSGGYRDATETQVFWKQVADELETAFANGSLERRDGLYLSGSLRPISPDQIGSWVSDAAGIMWAYPWGDELMGRIVWDSGQLRAGNGSLDEQIEAREYLGGNTILGVDGGVAVADSCTIAAFPWLDVTHVLGVALVWISRAVFVLALIGSVYLIVTDTIRKNHDGVRCGIVVSACLLSALVLTLAVSWMISFESDLTVESIAFYAFCYLGPVYILWNFIEMVVLGRFCCELYRRFSRGDRTALC